MNLWKNNPMQFWQNQLNFAVWCATAAAATAVVFGVPLLVVVFGASLLVVVFGVPLLVVVFRLNFI